MNKIMEEITEEITEEVTAPSADAEGAGAVEVTESTITAESACEKEFPALGQVDPAFKSRRQRILEHRVRAQTEDDTMTACLAGVLSDLLDTELTIGECLRQGLASGGVSFENIMRHSPLIEAKLRSSKLITQIAQFELRVRKNNDKEESAPKPR